MDGKTAQEQILGLPKVQPPEQFRPPKPKVNFLRQHQLATIIGISLLIVLALALIAVVTQKRSQRSTTSDTQQIIFGEPKKTGAPAQKIQFIPKTGHGNIKY